MRKFLAIGTLVILGVLLFFYTGKKMDENKQNKPLPEYEAILNYDFEDNYPESIDEVMSYYNHLMKYQYLNRETKKKKEAFINEELPTVVEKIRGLYDNDLLINNPYDVQLEKIKKEIKDYDAKGIYIIDSKMNYPEIMPSEDEEGRRLAKVKVVYYTTVSPNIYMEYGLRETDGQWRVVGFKVIDQFKIVEE